jgi:hypothetical protein
MEPKKLGAVFAEYAQLAGELQSMEPEVILAFHRAMRDGISPEELAEVTKSFMRETARFLPLIQGLVALDKLASTAAEALEELTRQQEQIKEPSSCAGCPVADVCTEPAAVKFREKESTN